MSSTRHRTGSGPRAARGVSLAAAIAVLAALPLAGCSSFPGGTTASIDNPDPADKMYADADKLLNTGYYKDAAEKFEDLERNYPFSDDPSKPFARKALVLASFAYYKSGDYDNAIASGQRFVSLHAGSEDAALAHHVIGMSYFDQISESNRDQTAAVKAVEWFNRGIQQYPTSKFAEGDRNKLLIAKDNIAAAEMNVGRYYLQRRNYLAAVNRFKTVVANHQTTRHVEEALERIVECYMALGIKGEAQNAAAILGHNFPNSKWYRDAYALLKSDGLEPRANSGSWLSKAWGNTVAALTGKTG